MATASPCRTYIMYRHALFAQGVRSVLECESGVEIVGMENNIARATKAVQALHPEVILVEEPVHSEITLPFLGAAAASRIVTFSLHHAFATVFSHHRTAAAEPSDLVKAIKGSREWEQQQDPRSDSRDAKTSTADRLTADESSHSDGLDPVRHPEASRARKERIRTRRATRV